jgi:O-antigen ligase
MVASFGLLLVWSGSGLMTPSRPAGTLPQTKDVVAMFLIATIFPFAQLVPLPPLVGAMISETARGTYAQLPTWQPSVWTPISVDAGSTLEAALKSCAYLSIFILALGLVNSRARLRQTMWVLVGIGSFQALAGLADAFYNGELFGNTLRGFGSQGAAGTYTGRNRFAGLLEMTIPFCATLVLAQTQWHKQNHKQPAVSVKTALQWLLGKQILPYLMLSTMVAGLLFSTSRGGIMSFGLACLVVIAWSKLQKGSTSPVKLGGLGLGIVLVLAATLAAQPIIERFEQEGFETDRQSHREMAYRVFADFPVLGSGAGTWTQVYPAYQAPETYSRKIVNSVHNNYLELLVEQGVIGFVLFGSAVLFTLYTIIRGLQQQHDPLRRAALYGTLTAMLSTLIHSLVSFALHTPANAAIFSVVMALGLIAARMPSRTDSSG